MGGLRSFPVFGQDAPVVELHPEIVLSCGRAHEICGSARRTFAVWLAAHVRGPVIWIEPDWVPDRLNPEGMVGFCNPSRFVFVTARRKQDLLWVAEEALRSQAAQLVVSDLPQAPGLVPTRRLHLAAAGREPRDSPPVCLLLTPDGAARGIGTRWCMTGAHGGSQRRWRLERLRDPARPPKTWIVALETPERKRCPSGFIHLTAPTDPFSMDFHNLAEIG